MNINELLKQNNFRFEKKFGQNFITDINLLTAICVDSQIAKCDTVVEIGAGAGTLTRILAENSHFVHSFEIDKRLETILGKTLADIENVKVHFEDFLLCNLSELEKSIDSDYVVVANLPYYITTPIIMKLLEESTRLKSITIMVQEEVASRLVAKCGTKDYGAITVAINLLGTVNILRKVPRSVFMPMPNVDSAIVKITLDKDRQNFEDKKLRKLIRAAFAMRRKTLINNLQSSFNMSKDKLADIFSKLDLPLQIRGEVLSPEEFVRIVKYL